MATREQIARRLEAVLKTADQRGQRLVFTGLRISDSQVTMQGAPQNQMFVRFPDSSREYTTVWGRVYGTSAPIWVGPAIDGGEEYKGPAWEIGTLMYGDAYLTMVQPVVITELLPQTVGEYNFKPARLGPSQEGGTYVHVEAFDHSGGRWTGAPDLDITANYPSDPIVTKRVGIYLDPSDNSLNAFDGEEVYDFADFTDGDRALVPEDMYPIGAVYLTTETVIGSSTRFDDWRLHMARKDASVDAEVVSYTEAEPADWTASPEYVAPGLDELASRVADLEDTPPGTPAFTDLTDAFSDYTGHGLKYLRVKSTEDGVEPGTPSGGIDWKEPIVNPPSSPDASNDEFNDASLDVAWTVVENTSPNLIVAEGADVLSIYHPGGDYHASEVRFHGLVKPIPGTPTAPITIETAVRILGRTASDYVTFGLTFTDGDTWNAGNQVQGLVFYGATAINPGSQLVSLRSMDNWKGTNNTAHWSHTGWRSPAQWLYLRLTWVSANTWRFEWSPDGVSWMSGGADQSNTLTPTHFGFCLSDYGANLAGGRPFIASFDYFRVS